jgi:hypothetical protein
VPSVCDNFFHVFLSSFSRAWRVVWWWFSLLYLYYTILLAICLYRFCKQLCPM